MKENLNKTFKGTPGPWEVMASHSYSVIGVNKGNEKLIVYAPFNHSACMDDWQANAALIAAAPDMLEVLCDLENDNGEIPPFMWDRIQSIITKATTI